MAKASKSSKESDSKLWAFLAVLLGVVGFILALLLKKDDKYVMHYAKQGLVLFIGWVIAWGVGIVPFVGKFASVILFLILIVLWIITLVNSLSNEIKQTPLIGEFSDKIKL